jgi:predicted dehydrogenase
MAVLRVAIAGYGVVGRRRRVFIDRRSDMKLVAVCDREFTTTSSTHSDEVRYYSDYRNLLQDDFDVLFVCLTNDLAGQVVIDGLNRGLHVFCEKPPGRNVEDILRVIECEKNYPKLKLMYGFNHRYHESVRDALQLIQSGKFGRILNMRGVYGKSKLITFNQPDWRTKREIAGGGVLLDQGIHMVDLMRLFAGEFTEVHSFISNSQWGYDVEDNAYALMKTETGVVGMLHSSATEWRHRFSLDINLERGSIILGGILSGSKSYGAETLTVVTADHENDNGDPREQITRYNKDPSWEQEVGMFADFITHDLPVSGGSSLDALNTMRLVFKIYCADHAWQKKYSIPNSTPNYFP